MNIFRAVHPSLKQQTDSVLISMRQCKAHVHIFRAAGTPLTEAVNRQYVNFNKTMQSMCIFSGRYTPQSLKQQTDSVLISMRQCGKACAYFQGGTLLTEAVNSVLISMKQCKACAYFQGGTPLTEAANRQCVNFNETMQSMCIFSGRYTPH